jgi:nucleotide-binding universal stress UspA family protein
MERSGSQETAFLSLDELAANPRLARRFPPELARRFHVLPIAEQNGRVTVAMANPDDHEARDAVVTALGLAPYMVRVDPVTIDSLISAVWSDQDCPVLQILVCGSPEQIAGEVADYAQKIGNLLGADIHQLDTATELEVLHAEPERREHDLIIVETHDHPLLQRLLSTRAPDGSTMRSKRAAPPAVLVAGRPRWPLGRILLIMWGEAVDEAAIDWMLRLARAARSTVTALAVVPQAPAMYGQGTRLAQGLPMLLTSNTAMGRRMRQTARHLVEWEIEGMLRLRQGPPDWQIRRELAEGNYDLIVLAVKPRSRWLRWLEGDSPTSLLHWTNRPTLLVTPTT